MRASGLWYLSFLPTAVIGLALSVVSCGATLWQRASAEIKQELSEGKTEFVLAQTPATLHAADVGVLGEGAAWNLGTVFFQADRLAEAELLWSRSLAKEGSPWREMAGQDLFSLYESRRDWPKAETVAEQLVAFDRNSLESQRRLFEAYYFQKKDDQAWAIFRTWKPGAFSEAQERENRLFFGVLSGRTGKTAEAVEAFDEIIFRQPASSLHVRLESFFQEDETRAPLLSPAAREGLAFQSLVYRGGSADLRTWLKGRTLPDGFWSHRVLIEGIEAVFKAPERAETGLRILDEIRPGLTGEAGFAADYARGRLYRSLSSWALAVTAFQRALPQAVTDEDRQKTGWNWLNAWVRWKPEAALDPFVQVYSRTSDPAFFTDVFDVWMTELVQDRQWRLLAAIYRDLGGRLDRADRATVAFILGRLAAYGLVDLAAEGISLSSQALLEQTIAIQPFSYEAVVARAVLGLPLEWPTAPAGPGFQPTDLSRQRARVWETMVAFGLGTRVAAEVLASAEPLDPAFVDRVVAFLQARQHYRPSLQILYRLLRDPGQVLTQDRARVLYPRAFESLVLDRARAENLEVSLLMGLMREESSFDPRAKSWVGAQGLTQLMPATAAETARSLKMKTYDLSDPTDNITIGARYLATMIRSQGRIYLALMAYNAGGGRIRPWKADLGRLPEEIFVEATPLAETRGYVKRILTSTVMIGVLHYGKTLDDMVRLIYPGFRP